MICFVDQFAGISMFSPAARFMLKHLDCELTAMMESSVPPADITSISAFRGSMQKHAKQASNAYCFADLVGALFLMQVSDEKQKAAEASAPQVKRLELFA